MNKLMITSAILCSLGLLTAAASSPSQAAGFSHLAEQSQIYAINKHGALPNIDLTAHSQDSPQALVNGAQNFIETLGQRALNFLEDDTLDQNQKKAAFRTLLNDSFDMNTIGRFTVGRYWRAMTPDQRREYLELFKNMIIDVYSTRFSDYQGQSFSVAHGRADNMTDALVTSFIQPQNGSDIQIDWRVRHKNGRYKVVDVIVEGVSMSVTQRSDFSAIIQRGGGNVSVLLAHLNR